MNILNNIEIKQVSGGWVCDAIYNEKPFSEALFSTSGEKEDGTGFCFYGSRELNQRRESSGPDQSGVNSWGFGKMEVFLSYVCRSKDPNKCKFRD